MGDFEEFENTFEDQYGCDDDINPDYIEDDEYDEDDEEECPKCECIMEPGISGLKCANCGYWESY